MPGAPGLDTYTENDVGANRLRNITADSVDIVDLRRADIPVNLGKTIPSTGEIAGDGIRFKIDITADDANNLSLYTCILSNVANKDASYYSPAGGDREAIVVVINRSGGGTRRIQLLYFKTDGGNINDTFNVNYVTTDLFCEVLRNSAKTQTTLNIYSTDSFDVGDLLDTLINAGTPTTEFTEHYGAAGFGGTAATTDISGVISEYIVPWISAVANNVLASPIFGSKGVLGR